MEYLIDDDDYNNDNNTLLYNTNIYGLCLNFFIFKQASILMENHREALSLLFC